MLSFVSAVCVPVKSILKIVAVNVIDVIASLMTKIAVPNDAGRGAPVVSVGTVGGFSAPVGQRRRQQGDGAGGAREQRGEQGESELQHGISPRVVGSAPRRVEGLLNLRLPSRVVNSPSPVIEGARGRAAALAGSGGERPGPAGVDDEARRGRDAALGIERRGRPPAARAQLRSRRARSCM